MPDYPPKLQFATNVPLEVSFPFGDFKRHDNEQYGPSYRYAVEEGGQRKTLFATQALHDRLQELGVAAGAKFRVNKIELEGYKKGWDVTRLGEAASQGKTVGSQSPAGAHQGHLRGVALSNLSRLYDWCVSEAIGIWDRQEIETDATTLHATASTLFIQAARLNLWPTTSHHDMAKAKSNMNAACDTVEDRLTAWIEAAYKVSGANYSEAEKTELIGYALTRAADVMDKTSKQEVQAVLAAIERHEKELSAEMRTELVGKCKIEETTEGTPW